jgi:hypothetical protein
VAHILNFETAKVDRNLSETSFGFQRSFDDRNFRNSLPIGSGGEVSPHTLYAYAPMRRFGSKARLPWSGFDIEHAHSFNMIRRVRTAWAAVGIRFHSQFEALAMVGDKVPQGMRCVDIFIKGAPFQQLPERLL